MKGEAWSAAVHGVAKSQTQLSDFTFLLSLAITTGIEEKIENQLKKISAFCRPPAVPVTILYKHILK